MLFQGLRKWPGSEWDSRRWEGSFLYCSMVSTCGDRKIWFSRLNSVVPANTLNGCATTIIFTLKMESIPKIIILSQKMMVKKDFKINFSRPLSTVIFRPAIVILGADSIRA
jgi:hypothetical protein